MKNLKQQLYYNTTPPEAFQQLHILKLEKQKLINSYMWFDSLTRVIIERKLGTMIFQIKWDINKSNEKP